MATTFTRDVTVTQVVRVSFDADKFTPEFFAEFNTHFFDFDDSLVEHAEHLGRLHVAAGIEESDFIEGYGPGKDFAIKFRVVEEQTSSEAPAPEGV